MRPFSTRSRRMIRRGQGPRWNSISKVFSTISPPRKTSIRSSSTGEANSSRRGREKRSRAKEANLITKFLGGSHETSRFHKVECWVWGGGDACPAIAGARTDKINIQGIRRSAPRLSDRGGDREFGQKTRSCHQRAALDPDVSLDAVGRREGDHRTDPDRRHPDVACQRRSHGADRRRYQRRQHAV